LPAVPQSIGSTIVYAPMAQLSEVYIAVNKLYFSFDTALPYDIK